MTTIRAWISPVLCLVLVTLASSCSPPHPAAGLRPLPLYRSDESQREVDSLQPTLRWEVFPRMEDLKADTEGRLANARNVTYDLRIWRTDGRYLAYPAELVYARIGLSEPLHTVETPLEPATLYIWTIRARFELNGKVRVTQWGVLTTAWKDARASQIPHGGYYPFKTPKPQPAPSRIQKLPPPSLKFLEAAQ